MAKYVALMRKARTTPREEYFGLLLGLAREAADRTMTAGLIVDLVDVPPEEAGLRSGGSPTFDAVLEVWAGDPIRARQLVSRILSEVAGESHFYPVVETLEKARERDWPDGTVSPGIKSLYLMRRHPDLSHDAAVRHWAEVHVPKALKHHVGMWRYARNEFGPPAGRAEEWDGMAELHFRTSEDLINRFYDSDEGRRVIAEDVAVFSGGGRALHTHEWILKTPLTTG